MFLRGCNCMVQSPMTVSTMLHRRRQPVTWEEGHITQLLRILHISAVQCTCPWSTRQPRNGWKTHQGIHCQVRWSPFFWGGNNVNWCEKFTWINDHHPVFHWLIIDDLFDISYFHHCLDFQSCLSTKLLLLSWSKFLSKPCAKPHISQTDGGHWVVAREVDGNCIQGTACCNVLYVSAWRNSLGFRSHRPYFG